MFTITPETVTLVQNFRRLLGKKKKNIYIK